MRDIILRCLSAANLFHEISSLKFHQEPIRRFFVEILPPESPDRLLGANLAFRAKSSPQKLLQFSIGYHDGSFTAGSESLRGPR
jgi:hypothetical protein